jgi:Na+-driven multidrug efflux pump
VRYAAILMLLASALGCFGAAFTRKPIIYRFAKSPEEIASAAKVARVTRFLLGAFGLGVAIVLVFKS